MNQLAEPGVSFSSLIVHFFAGSRAFKDPQVELMAAITIEGEEKAIDMAHVVVGSIEASTFVVLSSLVVVDSVVGDV